MKKFLMTTMFGALFISSDLSAKVAGSTTGNLDVTLGASVVTNVKTKGETVIGTLGRRIVTATTPAAAANASIYTNDVNGATAKGSINSATEYTNKKTGVAFDIAAGAKYWITDAFGIGLDLGFGAYSAKVQDEKTDLSSKISTSFSIVPTFAYEFNENLSLTVGAGVAWTKVKDLAYVPETVTIGDGNNALDGFTNAGVIDLSAVPATADAAAAIFAHDNYKGKYVLVNNIQNSNAAVAANTQLLLNALNAHNDAILASHKSFKTKPCFTATAKLSYAVAPNNNVGISYAFKGVKSKVKDLGHEFKADMHVISVSYSYHF